MCVCVCVCVRACVRACVPCVRAGEGVVQMYRFFEGSSICSPCFYKKLSNVLTSFQLNNVKSSSLPCNQNLYDLL